MSSLLPNGKQRFVDNNGRPLIGGRVSYFIPNTSTLKDTWQDEAMTILNTNPIVLDARGECTAWGYGVYRQVVQDSIGNLIWDRVVSDVSEQMDASIAALREQLAVASEPNPGASMIGFIQSGVSAVGRSVLAKERDWISLEDFREASDPDDTDAFIRLINNCSTRIAPVIYIPSGNYLVTKPLLFDVPDNSTINFSGVITSTVTGSPAVRIGSLTRNVFGVNVHGLKVVKTTINPNDGATGVWLANLVASTVSIDRVMGFAEGVLCYGNQPNGGFSYNKVYLGLIHDNQNNLRLTATGSGYTNENEFFGGSFNHSSSYPSGVQTINLLVDYYATHRLNNNRFYCPSFEDNFTPAIAASINGDNILIVHPRMENPSNQANYKIIFGANSSECELIGNSFSLLSTNIQDDGLGNSYTTRNGTVIKRQSINSVAVLALQGVTSGANPVFEGKDVSGTTSSSITGSGKQYLADHIYAQNGLRFATADGTRQDRGVFFMNGSPEGVLAARPGSLCLNGNGGYQTTLYVKEGGNGNTGWRGV